MKNTKPKITQEKIWNFLVKMDERLEKMDERLVRMEKHAISVDIRLTEHDQRFDKIEKKLEDIDDHIVALQDICVGFSYKFEYELPAMSARITRLEKKLAR